MSSRNLARALARYGRLQRMRHGGRQAAVHAHRLTGMQRRIYLCLLRFALRVCAPAARVHARP